jgi:hypothetical protein
MQNSIQREKVRFGSGSSEMAAWHYPGTNGACVIMAGGSAVTKEPGTDLFAQRFHDAALTVLAFDYRHLGESGGQPRQVAAELSFLRRHLLEPARADRPGVIPMAPAMPGGERP